MEPDPDTYQRIVAEHIASRPPVIPKPEVEDVLRPEDIGLNETPYAEGSSGNPRGTGEGTMREPKSPEVT